MYIWFIWNSSKGSLTVKERSVSAWGVGRGDPLHKNMGDFLAWENYSATSLVVQWLRLSASTAESMGSTPGRRTKILGATCCSQYKIKTNKETKNPRLFNVLIVVVATLIIYRHKNKPQCILKKRKLTANFIPHKTKKNHKLLPNSLKNVQRREVILEEDRKKCFHPFP